LDSKIRQESALELPFLTANINCASWYDQMEQGLDIQLMDRTALHVRRMVAADVPDVCQLEHQIFSSPWTEEGFLYKLDRRHFNISLVGLVNGSIVAYAVSFFVLDEFHLSNLAVQQELRKKKIGETMLWLSLLMGSELGAQFVHLEVRKSNRSAIALYKKYHFEVVGIRKGYYEAEKEDALLMSRNLNLENTHGLV